VFGRKSVLDAGQRRKIAERYATGETMRELAIDYDVGEAIIWRALRGKTPRTARFKARGGCGATLHYEQVDGR
jgi:hypothetical protein